MPIASKASCIYFGGLLLLHHLVQRSDRPRIALPLAAYYVVTLALPLANGASLSDPAFVKHGLAVLVLPLLFVAARCGLRVALTLAGRPREQSDRPFRATSLPTGWE